MNPSAPCRHQGHEVYDHRSGCHVCCACGVVVDALAFGDGQVPDTPTDAANLFGDAAVAARGEWEVREFLHDSLQPEYDCSYTIDRVLAMLHQHLHKVAGYTEPGCLSVRHERDRGVLAFFVWETLNREGHPTAPQHICRLLDANVKHLRQAERCAGPSTPCLPSQYVPRLVDELELSFGIHRLLAAVCRANCDHLTHRPEIVVGGMLYHLLEHCDGDALDRQLVNQHCIGPDYAQLAMVAHCSVGSLVAMARRTLSETCKRQLMDEYAKHRGTHAELFLWSFQRHKAAGTLSLCNRARHYGLRPYDRTRVLSLDTVLEIQGQLTAAAAAAAPPA